MLARAPSVCATLPQAPVRPSRTHRAACSTRVAAARAPRLRRAAGVVRAAKVKAKAPEPAPEDEVLTAVETAALVAGLVATPVTLYSEFVLKTTGCGLPPGPAGSLGALEGVSYLVVVGILGLSASAKASTGSGLKAGPYGLLGAVEGLAFLALLAGLVVAGATIADTGGLPSPLPDARCFG